MSRPFSFASTVKTVVSLFVGVERQRCTWCDGRVDGRVDRGTRVISEATKHFHAGRRVKDKMEGKEKGKTRDKNC